MDWRWGDDIRLYTLRRRDVYVYWFCLCCTGVAVRWGRSEILFGIGVLKSDRVTLRRPRRILVQRQSTSL